VVFTVDPSWDDVAAYVNKIPLLQEYEIIKVVTTLGKLNHYIPTGPVEFYKELAGSVQFAATSVALQ